MMGSGIKKSVVFCDFPKIFPNFVNDLATQVYAVTERPF